MQEVLNVSELSKRAEEHEYLGKVRMAHERIVCQRIKRVKEVGLI